jgi:autotransporter-associated beta strand protein
LVTVTDSSVNQNQDVVPLLLTTTAGSEVWAGAGGDNQWSTGPNWAAGLPPVAGDTATFAGSTRTTPVMESAYSLGALLFNNTAASFNISSTGNTLTMTGGITNNSPSTQVLNMQVSLASPVGVQTFNAAAGTLVFSNTISSPGANGLNLTGGTNVFAAFNNYTGPTTISGGVLVLEAGSTSQYYSNNATLQLAAPTALGGNTLVMNSGSTLQLRGDANGDYTPGGGIVIPIASDTLNFDVNSVTPGVNGKTLSLANITPIIAFPTNFDHTINVTGNSTYTLGLGDILLGSSSHTPYFSLNINTVAGGATASINSITAGSWGSYVVFGGTGNAVVVEDLSNIPDGSLNLVVNGGCTVTLEGPSIKAPNPPIDDGYKYVVANGTLVLDNDDAITNFSSAATGLGGDYLILGSTTNAAAFYSAGNFTYPTSPTFFGTNNAYNAAIYLGDANNLTGGLYTLPGINALVSDGDVGFTNGGVFTIGGQNTSGVNIYSNNWILGMTAGGGKSVTLVAATGGEVDFDGNLLANSGNATAGATVGDAVHHGVVHLNGANTYLGPTLVTNGTLGGNGSIAGNVSVVNLGHTLPGGGTTLTIAGTLSYSTGGEADFNLASSASAGPNDQIVLNGASSSVNGGGVSVGVYLTASDLDQTTDYVLITNLTGLPNTGVFNATPIWKGAQPSAPNSYTVITRSNAVVLHYSTDQLTSGTALPSPVGRGQTVTVTVTAISSGTVSAVTLNASAIGAGPAVSLTLMSGNTYTNTVMVGGAIPGGTYLLPVTVTDSLGGMDILTLQVTVTSVTEVWDGGGADGQWSTGGNWASGFGPVSGDVLIFAGTTGLTANIQTNYSVNSLTFSNNAGAFNFTNNGLSTLTLGGGVTNLSPNTQTFNVPLSLNGAVTLNGAAGAFTMSNSIAGSGSLLSINATNTLAGYTHYAGSTTVGSGELVVTGTNLFYGAVSIGSGSTMIMSGDEGIGSTLTINSTGSLQITGGGQLNGGIFGGALPNGGSLIYSSTNSQSFYGTISGGGSLTQNSGILTLGNPTAAANPPGETYTGPTVVNGGTLYLGYNNPNTGGGLVTSSSITVNNGGAIICYWASSLEGYGSASTASPPLIINAGGLLDVSPLHTVNGSGFSAHIQGLLYLNGGTISNNAAYIQQYGGWGIYTNVYVNGGTNTSVIADFAAVPVSPNGTYFYVTNGGPGQTVPGVDLDVTGGLINCYGTTDTGIIVAGNGTMRLDGTNSYSAGTTISNSATLILGLKGQLNTVTRGNSLGNAAAQANILNGALGGAVYTEIYSSPLTFWNTGTFISTTTNRTTGVETLSGVIASGAPGAGTIEVSGAGSELVISGNANTFSGTTLVTNGGILVVSNTAGLGTGTNSLNIYAGSTLGGPGIIAGSVTNGGYLIPGITRSSVGAALSIGNLTLLASSTNVFAVSHTGQTNDSVIVGGTVTYGGTLTINASNTLAAGDTFTLFSAGAIAGSFTTINLPTLNAGLAWVNNLLVNGSISVVAGIPPTASFSGTPTSAFVTQPVVFANASTGTIASYAWSFGDGGVLNTTSGTNVAHSYTNAGTYTVSLTVSGSAGANTSTLTSYITVYPLLSIGAPVRGNGSLTLSGASGGVPGAQYRVLSSTNAALALTSWTPVYTNTFTLPNGGYSFIASPLTNSETFYIIVSP